MKNIPLIAKIIFIVGVLIIAFFVASKLINNNTPVISNQTNQTVDNTPLQIDMNPQPLRTYSSKASFSFKSNKDVSTDAKDTVKLYKLKQVDNKILYAIEFKNLPIGTITKKFKLKDESGQEKELSVNITRDAFGLPRGISDIEDWEGYGYTADGDNLLAQVNKTHKLTSDYAPTDLVDLNDEYHLYTDVTGIKLRKIAADALQIMLRDLKSQTGEDLLIKSGYRDMNTQYKLYAQWLVSNSQEDADKNSARPGFSEHQLGTSVDFTNKDVNYDLDSNFISTAAGKWLVENAYKYGFVQSYQEGKEVITGYQPEAWHWRFIGSDSAKAVKDSGLTLTEWLQKNNLNN